MKSMLVEHCQFKLSPNTQREVFMASVAESNEYLESCEGFIHRSLCFDEANNQWIDIVHWENAESAHKAAEAFLAAPKAANFLACIAEDSVTMQHFPVADEFAKGCEQAA